MLLTIDIRENVYDKVLYFLNHLKGDVEIIKHYDEPTREEILNHIKEGLQEVISIQKGILPSQGSLQDFIHELNSAD